MIQAFTNAPDLVNNGRKSDVSRTYKLQSTFLEFLLGECNHRCFLIPHHLGDRALNPVLPKNFPIQHSQQIAFSKLSLNSSYLVEVWNVPKYGKSSYFQAAGLYLYVKRQF